MTRFKAQASNIEIPILFTAYHHSKRASCLLLPPVLPTRASFLVHPSRSRNFNLDHVAVFKRIYRNGAVPVIEKSAINYPVSSPRVTQPLCCVRSFHPKAGSRRAISCGDAPTRAWRESDSKFHGVYIDSAELTLNTFARRAGGSHARRFVERHAFLNRDLSRPSLRLFGIADGRRSGIRCEGNRTGI